MLESLQLPWNKNVSSDLFRDSECYMLPNISTSIQDSLKLHLLWQLRLHHQQCLHRLLLRCSALHPAIHDPGMLSRLIPLSDSYMKFGCQHEMKPQATLNHNFCVMTLRKYSQFALNGPIFFNWFLSSRWPGKQRISCSLQPIIFLSRWDTIDHIQHIKQAALVESLLPLETRQDRLQ